MARGNKIIVSQEPRGRFTAGYIGGAETPKPGTAVQVDGATAERGGRWTWLAYNRDADGNRPAGPIGILLEDSGRGRDADTAYAAGDFAPIYIPLPGDELNLLFGNASGTADDVTVGMLLIINDGDGKFIPTTGSPETEVAVALEAYTDPTADRLLFCQWTGY